jgi:hypothetical protein
MGLSGRLANVFAFISNVVMVGSMRRRASLRLTEPVVTLTFFTDIQKDGKGEIDGEIM